MKTDQEYLELLLNPVRAVMDYRPRLGQIVKGGVAASEFQKIYGADPFYHWLGLDTPEVYTAHRVSGGLTSLYRQIGKGTDNAFASGGGTLMEAKLSRRAEYTFLDNLKEARETPMAAPDSSLFSAFSWRASAGLSRLDTSVRPVWRIGHDCAPRGANGLPRNACGDQSLPCLAESRQDASLFA